jgi:PQQ-like domain
MLVRFYTLCFFAFLPFVSNATQAFDNLPTDAEAEKLGLVVHWRATAGKARFGFGESNVVVWPHSRARKQILTIRVGNRIVEQIDASLISAELAAESEKNKSKTPIPTGLGLEKAREKAKSIVQRYVRLGRQATIEEIDQPLTYLVSSSRDGGVEARNAETGELYWSTSIGNSKLPTFGPGVNDSFVALANGNELYVLDLASGLLLGKRRMLESASAVPRPVDYLIYVPGVGGTLTAYEATNLEAEPITMRFTGSLTAQVVPSVDGRYVAWPEKSNMYVAQAGRRFSQWFRLESSAPLRGAPQATKNGFVIASTAGMVYRTNLNQRNSLVWKENLSIQISRPLWVADDMIMAIGDNGTCIAIEETTDPESKATIGRVKWVADTIGVRRILSVTPSRIYAQLNGGQLVVTDRATGKKIGMVNRQFAEGLPNPVNDRVLLQSETGSMLCLREPESIYPVMNVMAPDTKEEPKKVVQSDAVAGANTPDPFAAPSPEPTPTTDPFSAPAPAAGSPAMSDDPFGSTPSPTPAPPTDPANPFGS